jgi:predicted DNA binding protein
MSWWQRPYDVSKGAENNFKIFTKELAAETAEISKRYYHRLIAKAILFKDIDRIVMKKNLGGYKANMVSYILSWLSYKTNKKLNLDSIWEYQSISENVNTIINEMIPVVWKHINTPAKAGMNIGEWCKKQECWLTLKDKFIDVSLITEDIRNETDTLKEENADNTDLTPQELKVIEEARKISAETWFSVSKWAKENNKFTPFDRKLAYNLGVLSNRKSALTAKQARNALRILKQATDDGFSAR